MRFIFKAVIAAMLIALIFPRLSMAFEVSDFINKQNCDQILDKGYYQICYDYEMKGAKYVGYTLDGDDVGAVNIKKRPGFYADKGIPLAYRTKSSDYTHNRFHANRGHLAPDAAFDYSPSSLKSIYSMANIIPQYGPINKYTWSKAEKYARKMAVELDAVTVINGVVYDEHPPRLKTSGIAYPKAYWKMIFDDKGFERCFYYENNSNVITKGDKLSDHEVSCEKL